MFSSKYSLLIVFILIFNVGFYFHFNSKSNETTNPFASSVFMRKEEREIIRSYLKPTDRMLEYGSGYSTLYFSQFVQSYYSIEHDRQWYNVVKNLIKKSPLISSKIRQYLLIPVEKGFKNWRGGFDEGTREQFDEYIRGIHRLGVNKFDVVLIDGRARVECAKEIVRYLHRNSTVFVHDFTNRPDYWKISLKTYRFILYTFDDLTLVAFKLNRQ